VSATDDEGADTIEQVRLLFQEHGYRFWLEDYTAGANGYRGCFRPKGGPTGRPARGETKLEAARAAWDLFRSLPEGAKAPPLT
jgi:hypothetical protein